MIPTPFRRCFCVCLLCAAALCARAGSRCAASAPDGAQDAIDTAVIVDDVQVTAIKQGLALRGRPVAASVAGRETIRRHGIAAVKELSQLVPNFYIPDYGSRMTSSVYVRGLGARIDQPAMGLNVDNVPYLSKDDYDFDLADVERIEVLRGPQSTLYGRNTMGGVMNLYTLSPLAYQGTRLGAEYASGNTLRLRASTYHRPSPRTGVSLAARFMHSDGFFTNEYTGRTCDWERSGGARMRLQFRPDGRWSIDNTLSFGMLRQGGYPYASAATGHIAYNDPSGYRRTTLNDGLTVRYAADGWEIASITSYQYSDDRMTLDQDFLPDSYFTLTQAKQDHGLTEDIVVRSRGEGRYGWLVGAFGFYRHRSMQAPVLFKRTGIERLILENANEHLGSIWNERYTIDADELPLFSEFRNPIGGGALYHESTVELGRWRLSAALRVEVERTVLHYRARTEMDYTIHRDGAAPRPAAVRIDDRNRLGNTYCEVLPHLSLLYAFDAARNLYLTVSKGYKAGGFNTQIFSDILSEKVKWQMAGSQYDEPDLMSYRPEESWNYEIGGHFAGGDGWIRGDFALFWIDVRNQQLTVFPEGQSTGRMMTNAGRTRSRGGEFSLRIAPCRSLDLTAAYGYTDARFRRYETSAAGPDGNPVRIDYAGNRIPYAPQHTLSAGAVWRLRNEARRRGGLVLQAGLRGVGPFVWDEANTRRQSFYALADASVSYERPHWSLTIWGRNLTDTRYEVFYFKSIGNEFFQSGRPRTFGIALNIDIQSNTQP